MNTERRASLVATSTLISAFVLSACAGKQMDYAPATLEISASGGYKVNGVVVQSAALKTALLASKQSDGTLDVHFKPDPSAPIESVKFAMTVVRDLGGRIGLVGSVR